MLRWADLDGLEAWEVTSRAKEADAAAGCSWACASDAPNHRLTSRGIRDDAAVPAVRERVQPGVHAGQHPWLHAPRQRPGAIAYAAFE